MVSILTYAIIFHRVGLVILFTSTAVLPWFPIIFPLEDDTDFAIKMYKYMYGAALVGIGFLILTGVVRLTYSIPALFIVKALGVASVLYAFFILRNPYGNPRFFDYAGIRLFVVLLTTVIGLFL